MADESGRQISEFLDGELDESLHETCIGRLSRDGALKARFSRYVIIRDCIHRDAPELAADLADRVMNALSDEPVVLAPGNARHSRWRRLARPAAGIAVAASVATVALMGLRDFGPFGEEGASTPAPASVAREEAAANPANEMPQVQFVNSPLRRPVAEPASAVDRTWLNNYLMRHNEAAGVGGRTGFIPYVHIVTTEPANSPNAEWRPVSTPAPVATEPQ